MVTAIHDRPQMRPEEFEESARLAARVAEGMRWEFINGKTGVTPVPDGDHGRIIQWRARLCIQRPPPLAARSGSEG